MFSGKTGKANGIGRSRDGKPTGRRKPDFALALMRLFFLALAAIPLFVFVLPEPGTDAEPWRLALFAFLATAAILVASSVRKAREWERAVVLSMGRFDKVKGPGLYFVVPLLDEVCKIVDTRIRVTDFCSHEILTCDSVTVKIDAACFWTVGDPGKAALEVEDCGTAVAVSAKAAIRSAVSKNDLGTFLLRGDLIERQIQQEVERQTAEWGVAVRQIEITEIRLPDGLQSRLVETARAEREKKGRVLLAEAEIEIAKKLQEAASVYAKDEAALRLRAISIPGGDPGLSADEPNPGDFLGLRGMGEPRRKRE